jgi:hypothetical protein
MEISPTDALDKLAQVNNLAEEIQAMTDGILETLKRIEGVQKEIDILLKGVSE